MRVRKSVGIELSAGQKKGLRSEHLVFAQNDLESDEVVRAVGAAPGRDAGLGRAVSQRRLGRLPRELLLVLPRPQQ